MSGVVYGVLSMLKTQLERTAPQQIVLAWGKEGNGKCRKVLYSAYKATRPQHPNFRTQLQDVQRFLSHVGWEQYYTDTGWEADDVIATLTRFYVGQGRKVTILSGDHDFHQLVSENVTCVVPGTRAKPDMYYTPEKIRETYGVEPALLVDVFSLCGEASDNIAGVPSIGEITAQKLIAKHGALDTWWERLPKMDMTTKIRELLYEYWNQVQANRQLIDLSIQDVELCEIERNVDVEAAATILRAYEIQKFATADFTLL
jgi:DNA polymerase-1